MFNVFEYGNEIVAVVVFITTIVTAIQAFRNGAKDKALNLAKDATTKLAGVVLSDDAKLEAAVNRVYDGLISILSSDLGPFKYLKVAKPLVLLLIPKTLVVDAVKKAWHLYVKPELLPTVDSPSS